MYELHFIDTIITIIHTNGVVIHVVGNANCFLMTYAKIRKYAEFEFVLIYIYIHIYVQCHKMRRCPFAQTEISLTITHYSSLLFSDFSV